MKCLICQTENEKGAVICNECGLDLKDTTTVSAAEKKNLQTSDEDTIKYLLNLLKLVFSITLLYAMVNIATKILGHNVMFIYQILRWLCPLAIIIGFGMASVYINNRKVSNVLIFCIVVQIISVVSSFLMF